jgi:hypothetical protein
VVDLNWKARLSGLSLEAAAAELADLRLKVADAERRLAMRAALPIEGPVTAIECPEPFPKSSTPGTK